MTIQIQRAVAATTSSGAGIPPRLLASGERLERDVLAGCIAHPELVRMLTEAAPEHFDSHLHRRLVDVLGGRTADDDETVALRAELDARAAAEGIDENTAKELVLRLHERHLRRELQSADLERVPELQAALERLRQAVGGLT
jgi:hypothetical protein